MAQSRSIVRLFILGSLLWLLFSSQKARALEPEGLLLIVNRHSSASLELARLYQQKREIPPENLLRVTLPETEDLSREQYQEQLVKPLREFLQQKNAGQSIRCLVLFYGIPLRVAPPELSHKEWQQLEELKFKKQGIDWQIKNSEGNDQRKRSLQTESEQLGRDIAALARREQGAAVDSELVLALNDNYPLEKWQPNPYFVGFQQQKDWLPFSKDQVLMVARLDGPTPEIVRRMIDDSLSAEAAGLQGKAYFDARWPLPKEKNLQGYALYDASLHEAAELTETLTRMPMTLDEQEQLLQPGSAPDAALYSGWYSLGKYVDAFDWRPGAVAYHIASSECTTLKKEGSQVWC
ncbi:MAG TPA: TIGR03790 family protein, partial [Candidatus Krumholzibacteria bacterium]